jgi:hypothetical protein
VEVGDEETSVVFVGQFQGEHAALQHQSIASVGAWAPPASLPAWCLLPCVPCPCT